MYTDWYRTFLQALIKFTYYNSCLRLSFLYKFLVSSMSSSDRQFSRDDRWVSRTALWIFHQFLTPSPLNFLMMFMDGPLCLAQPGGYLFGWAFVMLIAAWKMTTVLCCYRFFWRWCANFRFYHWPMPHYNTIELLGRNTHLKSIYTNTWAKYLGGLFLLSRLCTR